MRYSIGLAWVAGFLIASALPLRAQSTYEVFRDKLNERTPAPAAPARVETTRKTTIVVPRREVVVVERVQARDGWWRKPGYQVITVYYDGGRFYRRPFDRRPVRKVVVYRRAGRYYIDEAHWGREHRRHYGRDYRWNDDDKRRRDDRWKDDDRWRDDDRRNDDDDRDGRSGNNGRHLGHDKDKDGHND